MKRGGKTIFGLGVLCTAILTCLLPLCAPHLDVLLAIRAVMGLCESVTFPAAFVMASCWFPAKERSRLLSIINAGAYIGTAIAFPVSGMVVDLHKDAHINAQGQRIMISTTWYGHHCLALRASSKSLLSCSGLTFSTFLDSWGWPGGSSGSCS